MDTTRDGGVGQPQQEETLDLARQLNDLKVSSGLQISFLQAQLVQQHELVPAAAGDYC